MASGSNAVTAQFGEILPRAFLQYNHPSRKFNVTAGLFEPRAVLASSRLRMIRINDYLSNHYGVPPTGNSFSLAPNQRGLEVWGNWEGPGHRGRPGMVLRPGERPRLRHSGRSGGVRTTGGGVQRSLAAGPEASGRTSLENKSSKDAYFGANYKFGGLGVLGGVPQQSATSKHEETSLTVGGFYYRG